MFLCPTQALFLILGPTTMPREIENKAFAKVGKEARGKQRAYSQIVILELLVMLVEEIVIKLLLTPKIAWRNLFLFCCDKMFYDNVPGTKLRIRRAFVHTNPAYEIMCLIEVCTDSSGYTSYPIACVASVSNRVTARKLELKRKTKRWKREGKGRIGSVFPLPLPRHSFFFCSRPDVLDELARKRLLRRLRIRLPF